MKCPYCESELEPCGEGKHEVGQSYYQHLICTNPACLYDGRVHGKAYKCDDPMDPRSPESAVIYAVVDEVLQRPRFRLGFPLRKRIWRLLMLIIKGWCYWD